MMAVSSHPTSPRIRHTALVAGLVALSAGLVACEKSEQEAEKRSDRAETRENDQAASAGSSGDEAASDPEIPGGRDARTFEFTYEATVQPDESEEREGPVDIFLPVATDTNHQSILEREIDAPVDGKIREESTYGNSYWHAELEELPEEPMTIRARYRVRREVFERADLEAEDETQFEDGEREEFEPFLSANKRVPTSGELLEEVSDDIDFGEADSPLDEARAIYEYVVDTMEYKKVGDGWGNGDTYWACSEKYGNCTDFHALFTSLARYREIPARFEIGFPIPTDRQSGKIGGYHCWLDFYLPGVGWTPIDASEAKKHPELREVYFGTHPANRVQFTVGRDLRLGDAHDSKPLNFFIYPMVEIGGERYEEVETTFSYEETTS